MDLSINSNRQNFGMAVLIADSAKPIIKRQTMELSHENFNAFWNKLNSKIEEEAGNPVNTIIRKANHRNALAAEVVDTNADTAIKNYVTAQWILSRNGSLKFLDRAVSRAQKLNLANEKLEPMATATENDFVAGGTVIV